jgi:sugar transferase (PEP-CTERM/EpsH1 system associated)
MNANPEKVHIAHIIHRLDVGGLENGLVNLINHLPEHLFCHSVICLTHYTDFRHRIRRADTRYYALDKKLGFDAGIYLRLWRLLRALAPDIVHTRNLAALECQVASWLAGQRVRVHGEHGRDVGDLDGGNRKYRLLRRLHRPFVSHYIAVSRDLANYVETAIGVPRHRISQIYNGVDSLTFFPAAGVRTPLPDSEFARPGTVVIGTVGRMAEVKDQTNLARAFVHLTELLPQWKDQLRLIIVGDGPLREACHDILRRADLSAQSWLPGARDDVPAVMRAMDLFVLPSMAEGISNTVLEAMASGLPVVATRVGGNSELVVEGVTGSLAAASDPLALAKAIIPFVVDENFRRGAGREGRARVLAHFSLDAMIEGYLRVYQTLLHGQSVPQQKLKTT